MVIREFLEYLKETYPDAVLLDGLDDAITGVDTDGHVVYSYQRCCDVLIRDEGMTEEEAMEWIEYNTIRSLPYMGANRPVVMYER